MDRKDILEIGQQDNDTCVYENVIEWRKGDDHASITAPGRSKLKGMVKRAALHSTGIEITENKDGSIFAKVPVEYVTVRKPRKMDLTEDQRNALRERLKKGREKQPEQ